MEPAVQRFACTQCGKCCNRSPEVELSEAADLADVFVFRLMFRLHWLPRQLSEYLAVSDGAANASATFYEKKRLRGAFAARKYPARARRDGKTVEYTKYLMISALALDTSPGACRALNGTHCGIYERRPLGCRSVPFHYSRPDALAETDLKVFVGTTGYRCDTSRTAGIVLRDGRIVAPEIKAARAEALIAAEHDRGWSDAIVQRMNAASSTDHALPSVQQIEADAQIGAVTLPMCVAWQIAADIGLISPEKCNRLIELQLKAIDQELAIGACSQDARETLAEMRAEYARHLEQMLHSGAVCANPSIPAAKVSSRTGVPVGPRLFARDKRW